MGFHPAILGTVASEPLEMASTGPVSARQISLTARVARFTGLADFEGEIALGARCFLARA